MLNLLMTWSVLITDNKRFLQIDPDETVQGDPTQFSSLWIFDVNFFFLNLVAQNVVF